MAAYFLRDIFWRIIFERCVCRYAFAKIKFSSIWIFAARGLILPLGFLHKPKRGRNSLVWDTIEPLRPRIDARVFEFVAEHEFARSDFPQAGLNVFRLSRDVTSALLDEVMLPRAAIEGAAEWIVELIERDEPRAGLRRATSRRVTAGGLATLPDTSGGLALGE